VQCNGGTILACQKFTLAALIKLFIDLTLWNVNPSCLCSLSGI
jgi:hypothetical protein